MFTRSAKKAWRRLFVLTILTVSLIVLSLDQGARATTCCSTCDANLQRCFDNCHGAPNCVDKCFLLWDACEGTCDDGC